MENSLVIANWIIAIAAIISTLFVIILGFLQINQQSKLKRIEVLLMLDERFNSRAMRSFRTKTASMHQEGQVGDKNEYFCKFDTCASNIADFFEIVADSYEQKIITLEDISTYWGYWIVNYCKLLKGYIDWVNAKEREGENDEDRYYWGFEQLSKRLVDTKLTHDPKQCDVKEFKNIEKCLDVGLPA